MLENEYKENRIVNRRQSQNIQKTGDQALELGNDYSETSQSQVKENSQKSLTTNSPRVGKNSNKETLPGNVLKVSGLTFTESNQEQI